MNAAPTPRERALAALAEIDAIQDEMLGKVETLHDLRRDRAFARLATALDDLYGPLPAVWLTS